MVMGEARVKGWVKSGDIVRPLWVKFRVVFGCPEASDWAKVVIIDYFGMVQRTSNDSQTSIYV